MVASFVRRGVIQRNRLATSQARMPHVLTTDRTGPAGASGKVFALVRPSG